EQGKLIGSRGADTDITERKWAEEKLIASENNFRQIAENIKEVFWLGEPDWSKIYYISPNFNDVWGEEAEKLYEQPFLWIDSIIEEDKEKVRSVIPKTITKDIKEIIFPDYRIKKPDGSIVWISARAFPIFNSEGNPYRIAGIAEDITERKKAEIALIASSKQHEAILQSAMDGFWLVDMQGSLLEVNDAYSRMSGYTSEELLSMRIQDLEAAETGGDTASHIQKIMEQGFDRFESQHRRKDGNSFDVLVSVQFQPTDGGRFVVFLQDITERKQAAADNLKLREKAEMSSRLAAVGEMAAGIAHEINNPLTGVIGFSELLLGREDLPDDIKENLQIIAQGSHRVKDIVRRMLTFARQNKPVKTSANIHELIDNTLEIRSYVLRTANIEVIRSYDPSLPWVTVDPGQMQQVFLNLIVNAEFAMKKAHGKGTLVITTAKKDGHISISFKDDGMGMSHETKAKIFNPFFTTKQVNEGTGLGLSLSHSIILEHGGTIEIESEVGQGANFIITLPVTLVEEAKSPESTVVIHPSPEHIKPARILVVDDEEGIRKLVSTILTRNGHSVDTTGDAAEALTMLESAGYDIVLMDIRMPGMSGMEFYERITEGHPEMAGKVIFITGDTSDESVRVFLEQKNLSYITKPFDKETLLKKVNGLL
ncbi:MAG: PAS domain S-box protein, partial [Deltaproteobacteria bacterium]